MFEFKVKPGMTVQYRGEDWFVVAKSELAGGWWIQRTVDGRPRLIEVLRKDLSQSDAR